MVSYRVMLDVPRELIWFVSRLLAGHRREIGTRKGTRRLGCYKQAVFALAWFRDKGDIPRLGRGFGLPQSTAYRYLDEVIEVLAARAPGLQEQLVAMTVSFGPTGAASSGSTRRSDDALIRPRLPFLAAPSWQALTAAQGRTSSLRCGRSTLTCGSSPAIRQQPRKAAFQESSSPRPRDGAISSRHRTCPFWGGATSGRPSGSA